jgi:hypothetical protein
MARNCSGSNIESDWAGNVCHHKQHHSVFRAALQRYEHAQRYCCGTCSDVRGVRACGGCGRMGSVHSAAGPRPASVSTPASFRLAGFIPLHCSLRLGSFRLAILNLVRSPLLRCVL